MRRLRKILKISIVMIEIMVLLMLWANVWVFHLTNGRTFSQVSKVPPRACALVLGTSPKMKAAATLYHHGKIRKIIVSGEKSPYYNEPEAMKSYLVSYEGVPENVITEDFEGFSTRESILRCKNVFKESNVIIVSQGYHNLRALFFARNHGMNALGFDARDVTKNESFYRNHMREVLARVQAAVYYFLKIS